MDSRISRRTFHALSGSVAAGALLGGFATVHVAAQESTPVAAAPGPAIPPEITEFANDWPVWHGDLHANRSAKGSTITAENVGSLEVAWRVPITAAGPYGAIVAPVLIVGDVVYAIDTVSAVYAIDRATGTVNWKTELNETNVGPNGLAIGYGMLYGMTGLSCDAFALDAETGELVWRVNIGGIATESAFGAPSVRDNTVYVGTSGAYGGKANNGLYALEAQTGALRWFFDTTTDNDWGNPAINSGAGIWYQASFDDDGNVYIGTGNPGPTPGTAEFPNATSRPGPNLYSSSMVSLDPQYGSVRWYYQDRPHDIIDHDFQNTPVIGKVNIADEERSFAFGSGKTGDVAAVDTVTGQLIWKIPVGTHNGYGDGHDLPADGSTVQSWPGLYGGVETGPAYQNNTLYVSVVEMPSGFSANAGFDEQASDYNGATGLLLAIDAPTAQIQWQVELPQLPFAAVTAANDTLFVPLMNGTFNAYDANDGTQLFTFQAGNGFAAPPSVAGDLVIGVAGGILFGDVPEDLEKKAEIIAFRLPGGSEATPVS